MCDMQVSDVAMVFSAGRLDAFASYSRHFPGKLIDMGRGGGMINLPCMPQSLVIDFLFKHSCLQTMTNTQ